MTKELHEIYAKLVRQKAIRIDVLDQMLKANGREKDIKQSLDLIESTERKLSEFEQRITLETMIARDYFMERLRLEKDERIERKNCHSCMVYQRWLTPIAESGECPNLENAPDCYQKRQEKKMKREKADCSEYEPNLELNEKFYDKDGKEIQRINRLLGLLDDGLMNNYRILLKK